MPKCTQKCQQKFFWLFGLPTIKRKVTKAKTENHKMINGIVLRVDVTRKVSQEEENTTIIADDTDNTPEEVSV